VSNCTKSESEPKPDPSDAKYISVLRRRPASGLVPVYSLGARPWVIMHMPVKLPFGLLRRNAMGSPALTKWNNGGHCFQSKPQMSAADCGTHLPAYQVLCQRWLAQVGLPFADAQPASPVMVPLRLIIEGRGACWTRRLPRLRSEASIPLTMRRPGEQAQ